MEDTIRIGAYQGPIADNDVDANVAKVRSVMDRADGPPLDFLCFPEVYLSGYSPVGIRDSALTLDDPRLGELATAAARHGTVLLVGISEKRGDARLNTQLVMDGGKVVGLYRKTILTAYDNKHFTTEMDLPVFRARDIPFGISICNDTSFVEPALCLRWKGARLLFTPHYDDISPRGFPRGDGSQVSFWEHRTMVLNNQAALATLLKMVVVRSDVITLSIDAVGFGDAGIWDMNGNRVAGGEPFQESVVTAEFPKRIFQEEHWINRRDVPPRLLELIAEAAKSYTVAGGRQDA